MQSGEVGHARNLQNQAAQGRSKFEASQGYVVSSSPAIDTYHDHDAKSLKKEPNPWCQQKALILHLISPCTGLEGSQALEMAFPV